ncbi:type VI secretion system baseplate subunit TssF [Burkholderia thailandensis]|nr:type VI secretion system baseplate subunit TssF [Burkholderia thailandensis]MDD1481879.1 type VI secretion system baseplate subunit TssF [Burkholderia thailandensis]MDD1488229.1 type VI secretion system baseplate subunit TssF [Burkholderia thailandensis]MDD1494527.1 type VI secretion system baseplate subunit TssF [Burkholderia thailandensis]PJO71995.1 type VI secretion system baseplate subunit TssF [Burkholderia thailandensis]
MPDMPPRTVARAMPPAAARARSADDRAPHDRANRLPRDRLFPMNDLLPYYEREIAMLRHSMREFAIRHPKIATRFGIADGQTDDMHVERMLQSFALLGAQIGEALDDEYPEFTEALVETACPDYLRPFPACSIAQFDAASLFSQLTEGVTIGRGTMLESRIGANRFRTAYDVALAPVSIVDARFRPASAAPSAARMPPSSTGIVSITFDALTAKPTLAALRARGLRVHLHGDAPLVAALADTLAMRAPAAFIELDGDGRWKPLSKAPLAPVGFAAEDALLDPAHGAPPFRLLMEYFAFPAKFDFVDIDVARIARAAGPCRRLSLHLPVVGVAPDSQHARALGTLAASNLRLFCTPIVNLFSQDAMPISLRDAAAAYPVVPQALKSNGIEVRSIDAVRIAREGEPRANVDVTPYRSMLHGQHGRKEPVYWLAERDRFAHGAQPAALRLVDAGGAPVRPRADQLNVELSCTNGDYPQTLPIGDADGDLLNETDNLPGRITMLRKPTQTRRFARDHGALWRMIAAMTPHALLLQPSGLGALKALLVQYATRSSSAMPQIDAIANLDHKVAVRWMAVKPMPTFVRGIEVALTLNEAAFATCSLKAFIDVMDGFFALHAPPNGFIQLVAYARDTGRELHRCEPRSAIAQLV